MNSTDLATSVREITEQIRNMPYPSEIKTEDDWTYHNALAELEFEVRRLREVLLAARQPYADS